MQRTFVLADLHLTRFTPTAVTNDLVRVLDLARGARVVFAGDLLDLSAEGQHDAKNRGVEEAFGSHADVRAALGRHVDQGGELWFVSGNHDAEVAGKDFEPALAAALGLSGAAKARVRTTPWYFREGGLHIEHGHLYDPDNAPTHPLVLGASSLGVHFVEQFIAPTGAHAYLNANDKKPLELFLAAFRWYGMRGPYVVYRFFHAAFTALRKSTIYRADDEWSRGQAELPAFLEKTGVSGESAEAVLAQRAMPTLSSARDTFARLYLDRVAATVAMLGGGGAVATGHLAAGGASLSLGAFAMLASWARGHDRYGGTVQERLAAGADRVATATDAKLVVFGHTHREALGEKYANTGSFSFPREAPGRPFLEIVGSLERPRAERLYLKGGELLRA